MSGASWSWVAAVGITAAAPQAEPTVASPADAVEVTGPTVFDHLALAQRHRDVGDLAGALVSADAAVLADPRLAFAYLARAQIRIDLAGEPGDPQADVARARRWADAIDAAAADLDRYLDLETHDDATRLDIEQQRAALRAAAAEHRARADATPPQPPPPRPVAVVAPAVIDAPPPVHVDHRRRPGVALVVTGSVLAATGTGLLAGGLRIEQRCGDLCSARWTARPAFVAGGAAGAVTGAVLMSVGAAGLMRDRSGLGLRRARGVAAGLLGIGAGTGVAGATALALAGGRWRRASPSGDEALAGTQARANAGVVLLAATVPLVTVAITMLVRAAGHRDAHLARR